MEYKIVKKEAFRIVGVSAPLERELEKNFEIVPKMWQKAVMDGTLPKLAACIQGEPAGLLGVSFAQPEEAWKYYIAAATDAPLEEGWEEAEVPAATWAVFEGRGDGTAVQELEKRIMLEWLPVVKK